ncbi:MAG: molybdopterin-dependent oxidoreductase [Acidobacteria bacterium]|nr:molybdopterin-dependent oxidoreductase [Acidobacteriota bacterium]
MDRRNFFKIVSTASTGVLTGACGKKLDRYVPLLVAEREIVPGEEVWRPAACGECGAGCGVIVRVMEAERVVERQGDPVRERIATIKKIEGNPLDPVSGGRLCARGQAALQGLYNPDRLRGPLRRVGPKGKAEFAPTSWAEAIAVAAEKLEHVRAKDPSRILFLTGPQAGTRALTIARFLEALGAPPAVTFEISDFPIERKAADLVFGWKGLPVYDLANARYVLGVGADFLGGWASPVFYARQFGHFRQGRADLRGRLTQAESRMSITAQAADLWIPLPPGTEVLFTAAIAHLLLREKLARGPNGVPQQVVQAFEAFDVTRAVRACGVEERRLLRLARELGESERPLVMAGASVVQTNSLESVITAHYLNLLLGNVGKPGGVLPPAPEPIGGRPGFANALALLERTQFVFLDGANPAYTWPASTGVAQKLERVETLVSFAPFLDDSGAYADLLLPDHHMLEATAAIVPAVAPVAAVTLATQFVEPLYETRATEQVLTELAKKMELTFEPATPKNVLASALTEGQTWEEAVRQGGVWAAAGGVEAEQPKPRKTGTRRGEGPTAPALELSAPSFFGDTSQFPYYFHPYPSLQFGDGRAANLPWMQELPDPVSSAMWGLPVEIDPQNAARLGIRTGDLVRVESAHGRLEAPAYVHPAAIPGVISMAIGDGHRHFGRYASNRGANPLSILAPVWEKSTGALALGATRVRITRLASGRLIQFSVSDREQGPWGYR